jgi:hypothetical protein
MRQSVFDSYPEKRKRLSFFAAFADATNDEDEAVDVAQVAPILPTYFDSLPVLPAPVPLPLPGRGRGRGRVRTFLTLLHSIFLLVFFYVANSRLDMFYI